MTTVAVLVDPPRPGLVLPELAETSPLSAEEAADCYAAMAKDLMRAADQSGGELLVNYRPEESLPEAHRGGDAEAEVRALAADVDIEEPRFEVQVGETLAGRVGNTVTHLLDAEEVQSAAVVEPSAPFLTRKLIDETAMKLRRHDVVLGPAPDGRIHYAAFRESIDFTDAFTTPAVETLTDRALDVGHSVDFLPMLSVVETGSDLANALTLLRARQRAGRIVPRYTMAALDELGLFAAPDGKELVVRR